MSYPIFVIEISQRPVEIVAGNRFQLSDKERGALITEKKKHRKELQKRYGSDWKRYLNVPEKSVGSSVHWTF